MLKFKNSITICADKNYCIDVTTLLGTKVKTVGIQEVYLCDDKVYVGFDTYSTVDMVAKLIRKYLYKTQTKIVGGTIFVKFY